MRAVQWIQTTRAWALVLFAMGAATRAAEESTPSPAATSDRDRSDPDELEYQFSISMMGAGVSYGDTPFTFERGSAGDFPGAIQVVEPFGAAPFSGLRAYGIRFEERGVVHHLRFGLGFQVAFPRWRRGDVTGLYDVSGTARQISVDELYSKDVRLSLGLDLPIGPVHLYSDLVGTMRFVSARMLIDGADAKFGATTFGYAVEAGAAVSMGDGLRLGLQVERGLVGEQAWGASLAVIFAVD